MTRIFAAWLFALGLVGCDSDKPSAPTPPPPKKVEKVEKAAEPPAIARSIWGIPLPPETFELSETANTAWALTRLRKPDVESFYEKKLPDHERIDINRRHTEFISLHEVVPDVRLYRNSTRGPTRIVIRAKKKLKSPEEMAAKVPRKKGDPVDIKLPDGTPLAPGAVWGEPYTPPPGTPLAEKRYKSNWGKPFGQWIAQ